MKKTTPASKKPNKNKSGSEGKSKRPSGVVKQVKHLARKLAQAMSAKPAKKAQTKAAPTKTAPKPPMKESRKLAKPSKGAPVSAKVQPPAKAVKGPKPVPEKPTKSAKAVPATKELLKKGKGAEIQPSLPLPPVTGKGSKPGKAPVQVTKGKSGKTPKVASTAHDEKMCRETGCENAATTKGYCRLDYIKNWKKIKRKEMILKEGKLNQYIEELVSKYPDKYIDVIRQDLSTEVNFNKVIHDLELDESMDDLDYDSDSIDSLIGSIRKEDDGFEESDF